MRPAQVSYVQKRHLGAPFWPVVGGPPIRACVLCKNTMFLSSEPELMVYLRKDKVFLSCETELKVYFVQMHSVFEPNASRAQWRDRLGTRSSRPCLGIKYIMIRDFGFRV